MAISFIGSANGSTVNPTLTDQVTLSASIQAGDWIEIPVHNRYGDQSIVLEGLTDNDTGGNPWTLKGTSSNGRLTIWAKIATANTAGKVATATLDQEGAIVIGHVVYRSDAGGFHIDDSFTNLSFEANTSGNETHAGFTPDAADSLICLIIASLNDVQQTSQTCTDPGTLTRRFSKLSLAAQDHSLSFSANPQVGGPNATGNLTWTQSNVAGDSAAHALREVSAGGEEFLADVAITGAGAVGASAESEAEAASSVTGAGTVAASAESEANAAAAVTGQGTITVSAVIVYTTSMAVIGAGAVAGQAEAEANATAGVAGAGVAAVDAVTEASASAAITGQGLTTVDASTESYAVLPVVGAGIVGVGAEVEANTTVDVTVAGDLNVAAESESEGAVAVVGDGTITVDATISDDREAEVAVAGGGTVAISAVTEAEATLGATGAGTVNISAEFIAIGQVTVTVNGTLTVAAESEASAAVVVTGLSAVTVDASGTGQVVVLGCVQWGALTVMTEQSGLLTVGGNS